MPPVDEVIVVSVVMAETSANPFEEESNDRWKVTAAPVVVQSDEPAETVQA